MAKIHPTAIIHDNVSLGADCEVGPYCILGTEEGSGPVIGDGAVIRSHTVIYGGTYGPNLETGHFVLLRKDNKTGENLRIGSYSSLEGGASIGDYVRIHGRCEATKVAIRDFARIYGGTYLTDNRLPPGDESRAAIIREGAVICMSTVVLAGVEVGYGAFVGANSVVTKSVPPGHVWIGQRLRHWTKVTDLSWNGQYHPWTRHARHHYPPEAQDRIEDLHQKIMEACEA